jgi:hypothetical protein
MEGHEALAKTKRGEGRCGSKNSGNQWSKSWFPPISKLPYTFKLLMSAALTPDPQYIDDVSDNKIILQS